MFENAFEHDAQSIQYSTSCQLQEVYIDLPTGSSVRCISPHPVTLLRRPLQYPILRINQPEQLAILKRILIVVKR